MASHCFGGKDQNLNKGTHKACLDLSYLSRHNGKLFCHLHWLFSQFFSLFPTFCLCGMLLLVPSHSKFPTPHPLSPVHSLKLKHPFPKGKLPLSPQIQVKFRFTGLRVWAHSFNLNLATTCWVCVSCFLPFFVYEILGKILGLFSHLLNGLVVRIKSTSETTLSMDSKYYSRAPHSS